MKSDKVKKGFDPKYMMALCAAAGYDGNWTGMRKACGISTSTTMTTRRNDPGTFTHKEISAAIKNLNMTTYDVIRAFHSDMLQTLDEKRFYAEVFRKMSDWLSGGTDYTELIETLKDFSDRLDRIEKLLTE